jgi:hypothetical protein
VDKNLCDNEWRLREGRADEDEEEEGEERKEESRQGKPFIVFGHDVRSVIVNTRRTSKPAGCRYGPLACLISSIAIPRIRYTTRCYHVCVIICMGARHLHSTVCSPRWLYS